MKIHELRTGMTTRELSQLYYLRREIELCRQQLEELEEMRAGTAQNFDGMPHGKGPKASQVERLAADIVDLQAIIHAKQIQCIHERMRLERYIQSIPDSHTRQIFELRFVECLRWNDVADRMGPGNTAERVRKVCSRYIRQGTQERQEQ